MVKHEIQAITEVEQDKRIYGIDWLVINDYQPVYWLYSSYYQFNNQYFYTISTQMYGSRVQYSYAYWTYGCI